MEPIFVYKIEPILLKFLLITNWFSGDNLTKILYHTISYKCFGKPILQFLFEKALKYRKFVPQSYFKIEIILKLQKKDFRICFTTRQVDMKISIEKIPFLIFHRKISNNF